MNLGHTGTLEEVLILDPDPDKSCLNYLPSVSQDEGWEPLSRLTGPESGSVGPRLEFATCPLICSILGAIKARSRRCRVYFSGCQSNQGRNYQKTRLYIKSTWISPSDGGQKPLARGPRVVHVCKISGTGTLSAASKSPKRLRLLRARSWLQQAPPTFTIPMRLSLLSRTDSKD